MVFKGEVKTEWVNDGRQMKLLEDIVYTDSNNKVWIAHTGLIFDGASIPRFMWRVIGSPFVGKYRRAAIIHDQYYTYGLEGHPVESRKDTDKMFLEAMEELGVSWWKRKMMYRAVRWFGPKW